MKKLIGILLIASLMSCDGRVEDGVSTIVNIQIFRKPNIVLYTATIEGTSQLNSEFVGKAGLYSIGDTVRFLGKSDTTKLDTTKTK